jgi:putative PEP-CTERM system histidine kinase
MSFVNGWASWTGAASFGAAAVAYGLLAIIMIVGARRLPALLGLVACACTAAWSLWHANAYANGVLPPLNLEALDLLKSLAWLAFLWSLLREALARSGPSVLVRTVPIVVIAVAALAVIHQATRAALEEVRLPPPQILDLFLVVTGFALIENLMRNSGADQRWKLKFLCIGLGGLYVYDLFFFADALLFREINSSLELARGAVYALVAPLMLISTFRSKTWQTSLVVSQKTALYTSALVASGLYLILMAASAFYIKIAGGAWGPFIQAIFLFGALVLLTIILASTALRARLRVFVAKNFFPYKYDYRQVWTSFTGTVSETEGSVPLELRIIEAIADIVQSTRGAIWVRQRGRYAVTAMWNMAAASLDDDEIQPMLSHLAAKEWVLVVDDAVRHPEGYGGHLLPDSILRLNSPWLLLPLLHRSNIIGFIVLGRSRAPRSLDWEDFDLLRMLGRQSASYLAEQRAARELAEARQFERFNRRATFVMHDIKNLVSQLSLVSSNIEKHGDNPDFRKDMTASMADAVSRMRRLMERLHAEQEASEADGRVALRPLVGRLVASRHQAAVEVRLDPGDDDVEVTGDQDRLSAILSHVVDNAIDASGETGWVRIAVTRQDSNAIVEVTDNGPGMDQGFIDTELFKPFRSTKKDGFGIGAFQCRQYARELGGDVDVISSLGAGTTFRITLPAA